MSDRKIISINPELFNMNNTRKKKSGPKNGIKIKEPKINNKTTKGKLLRYIREQQEQNYKKLFDEKIKNPEKAFEPVKISLDETMNNDFEDSLNYLNNKLKEENALSVSSSGDSYKIKNNHTMKNNRITDKEFFNPFFNDTNIQPNIAFLNPPNPLLPKSNIVLKPFVNGQIPFYGCLKNGKLPTYRNYINQTRKNNCYNPIENMNSIIPSNIPNIPNMVLNTSPNIPSNPLFSKNQSSNSMLSNNEKLKKISEMKQINQLLKTSKSSVPNNLKYLKQKKTLRRTHYVGKSKKFPKIGVLVSNKTIRKNITTQTQLLKQESIPNIKKFLIKKGFIKVGSTAPNDVLRKMYESIILVGGEINNHNPENLLYNYLHES
jgi:hypothetical protein